MSALRPYTSDVEATSTFFFFLFASASTTSVPRTLVSIVRTGALDDGLDADRRRKVDDHVALIDQLGEDRLVMDGVDRVVEAGVAAFQVLDVAEALPVERSSTTKTSSPRAR